MKNIFKLFAIFIFVPFVVYGARPNNDKQQKQAQMRNEQTISHLLSLGRAYNHIDKAEAKEKISTNIQHEVDRWYMENTEKIMKVQQEEMAKNQQEGQQTDFLENAEQTKQKMVDEIKAGKLPDLMLKTLPEQAAERIKQRMNIIKEGKGKPASKGGNKGKPNFLKK